MSYFHSNFGLSNTEHTSVRCVYCNREIFVEKYEKTSIGTIFCSKDDGFDEDMVFCGDDCYKKYKGSLKCQNV